MELISLFLQNSFNSLLVTLSMDTKRLAIEINILRCLQPTSTASISSLEKLAKQVGIIKSEVDQMGETSESEDWRKFHHETYAALQQQSEISAIYEKRKSIIIGDNHLAEHQLDDGTKVMFDKNANCLILTKDENNEVL